MTPLLYRSLRQACAGTVPSDTLSRLQTQFYANLRRNFQLGTERARFAAMFRTTGLEFAVFKGRPPAWTLSENPVLRQMSDLDLLVRPGDADRAVDLPGRHSLPYIPRCGRCVCWRSTRRAAHGG